MNSYLEAFPKRLIGIYFFDFGGGGGGGGDGDAAAAAATAAADAQVKAAEIAANTIMSMYQTTRADIAPWKEAGEASLKLYASLLNIPGYGPEPTLKPGAVPTSQTPIYGPVPTAPAPVNNFYRDPATGNVFSLTPEEIAARGGVGVNNLVADRYGATSYEPVGGGGASVPTGPAPITGYTPQYAPEDYITPDIGEYMSNYLRSTPGYQFRMDEGVNALNRSAAAKGMLYSGAQQKALTTYGQGLADQTYNALLDRIANLSTGGQNAAAQLGGIGANAASGVAQTQLASGQAQAQGIYNAYNARQSAYNTGQNNLMGMLGLGTGALASSGALSGIGSAISSLFGGGAAATGGITAGLGGYEALMAALSTAPAFFSDKRTKKHIKPLRRGALKKINRLNPVTFQYKDEFGGTRETGYVADEVEKVAPGAVIRGPGGLRMIKPLAMNALLTQAVQEQQQQINALRRAA